MRGGNPKRTISKIYKIKLDINSYWNYDEEKKLKKKIGISISHIYQLTDALEIRNIKHNSYI